MSLIDRKLPRFPMYVPTKGRYDRCLTATMFDKDKVPYRLVVEEKEADFYRSAHPGAEVLVLPFSDMGSVVPARNWIRDHAEAEGHPYHWQFDDNIRIMYRHYRGQRLPCRAGVALLVAEDFTTRYTNVGISGFNYSMFAPERRRFPPFRLNSHVYSALLINHDMPHRWRGRRNEDTDLCLQALSTDWCTIQINAFLADKIATLVMGGGNTAELDYLSENGRLMMARELERRWPGVVTTTRRFGRPQHKVAFEWKRFDTQLIKREDLAESDGTDNYGMELQQVAPTIKSAKLRKFVEEERA